MLSRESDLSALLSRPEPGSWERFSKSPVLFIAHILYDWHRRWSDSGRLQSNTPPVFVVCIADTHNKTSALPAGDILVHAGDLTQNGSIQELQKTLDWLNEQPHDHKVVIAGNHDTCLEESKDLINGSSTIGGLQWGSIIYLQDSSTTVNVRGRDLHVFGSPWTRRHGNWAFQYAQAASTSTWRDKIPEDTDILLTHGPPMGHLDLGFGCASLLQALWRLQRKPFLHVFGHIHGGYGQELIGFNGVQAAYEDIVAAKGGGFWRLCMLFGRFCWYHCSNCFHAHAFLKGRKTSTRGTTILVNAAQVGGLRDNLARPPVVVTI